MVLTWDPRLDSDYYLCFGFDFDTDVALWHSKFDTVFLFFFKKNEIKLYILIHVATIHFYLLLLYAIMVDKVMV